jgi:hypothetical protein
MYGTDITTVKYLKLRKVIKITHDIIEIDSPGATNLNECSNFADAQIMSVTGHKSVSSLSIYQRTSDQKTIKMGTILNSAMTEENNNNNALPSCRHYPHM